MPDPSPHRRHAVLSELVVKQTPTHDLAHNWAHVERVHHWCIRIATELGEDADLAGAAGLVHDLLLVPKDHADRASAGELSAARAPELLQAAGYDEAEIAVVCDAVRTGPWSAQLPPSGPIGAILQDADRLDAIGVTGAFRNIAVAQDMARRRPNNAFWHPTDPLHLDPERPLNDGRFALDHWHVKLLTLADGMNTAPARREGARRHAHMLQLLDMLATEQR